MVRADTTRVRRQQAQKVLTYVRAITEGASKRETKKELEGGHEPPNTRCAIALADKRRP